MDAHRPDGNPAAGARGGNARQAAQADAARDGARVRRDRNTDADTDNPRPQQRRRNALALGTDPQQDVFGAANASLRQRRSARLASQAGAPVALVASVREGALGSIYFDNHRIRTTHFAGPGRSTEPTTPTLRFNIDQSRATDEFLNTQGRRFMEALVELEDVPENAQFETFLTHRMLDARDRWMAQQLQDRSANNDIPDWAAPVTGPENLPEATDPNLPPGQVLFEVMPRGGDTPPEHHISRGMATQITLSQAEIDALHGALEETRGQHDVNRRNERFFDYLGSHAPRLAEIVRRPSQV